MAGHVFLDPGLPGRPLYCTVDIGFIDVMGLLRRPEIE
jgi:hypothetical protein